MAEKTLCPRCGKEVVPQAPDADVGPAAAMSTAEYEHYQAAGSPRDWRAWRAARAVPVGHNVTVPVLGISSSSAMGEHSTEAAA